MSKERRREPDPFADIRELQDHRYDPGHFTGGRVDPILKARRPNPYGYVLLVGGFISIFLLAGAIRSGQTWMAIGMGLGGLINIAVGSALIQRRPRGGKS